MPPPLITFSRLQTVIAPERGIDLPAFFPASMASWIASSDFFCTSTRDLQAWQTPGMVNDSASFQPALTQTFTATDYSE